MRHAIPAVLGLALALPAAGADAAARLKNELARVPGVADVRVIGVGEFGVRVWLNPVKLRAYNLTAGDVADVLRRENARGAAGAVGGPALRLPVTASGRLTGV